MLESAIYFVTRDIAIRSGLKDQRYRISDGRYVLDNKDLSRVRFTVDEYVSGLQGVEKTDETTAQRRIAENGYRMGDIALATVTQPVVEEPEVPEVPEEPEEPEVPEEPEDSESEEPVEEPLEEEE